MQCAVVAGYHKHRNNTTTRDQHPQGNHRIKTIINKKCKKHEEKGNTTKKCWEERKPIRVSTQGVV